MLIKLLPQNMKTEDYEALKGIGVNFDKEYNVDIYRHEYQKIIEDSIYLKEYDVCVFNNNHGQYFELVVRRMTFEEIEKELGYCIEIIG